ncbi:Fibronectin type III [Trinorchestia longiramus]|nr:Fibronectin type III [Trinorchestia longiramus]
MQSIFLARQYWLLLLLLISPILEVFSATVTPNSYYPDNEARYDPSADPRSSSYDPSRSGSRASNIRSQSGMAGINPWRTASLTPVAGTILTVSDPITESCPSHWVLNEESCYKFVRSPKKNRNQARTQCKAYGADLVSVSSKEEHGWLTRHLHKTDPLHRRWYTSARQSSPGAFVNEGDSSSFNDMMEAILPDQPSTPSLNYLAYVYSDLHTEWGLLKVEGDEALQYICEIPLKLVQRLKENLVERTSEFGVYVSDPRKVPHAPVFTQQPKDAMFDLVKRDIINYVSITCLAEGYPHPMYKWYKEEYEDNIAVSREIDPMSDRRFTVSGGTLVISEPDSIKDRGNYHCRASNEFGTVTSESVQISFAYVAEFNLLRSPEQGNQFWGKAIFCDPPQHYPDVHYYWARNFFPNLVEEDSRTMVSYDGNLYFSYLDFIDRGRYSCNVKSTVSGVGKNGPLFTLEVIPLPNYQQLKFANNFPKAFPESPIRGQDVRLECIAFGYPVPSYKWSRRNGNLPRGAKLSSYDRVLTLPAVQPGDVGEYVCQASNEKLSIEDSINLSIQAKPSFTIPLHDQFMAEGEDLLLECEAFGIPDVEYEWLRNSELLNIETMSPEDAERYTITTSVLQILSVKKSDEASYQCKASNQLGAAYSAAQLRVFKLAPTFRKQPLETEKYAAEGMNTTLECNPEAAPVPDFVWRKNGIRIGGASRTEVLKSSTLVITSVTRDDAGNYSCTATNVYGSASSSGRLIVLRRPEFYRAPPEIIRTSVQENVILECEAYTDPILDMAYYWRQNGLRIHTDDRTYLRNLAYMQGYDPDYIFRKRAKQQMDRNLYQVSSSRRVSNLLDFVNLREPPFEKGYRPGHLLIPNVTLSDSGVYECVAKTPVATIAVETIITVDGPPGPPGGVTAVDVTSTMARVRWTDGASNGRPIQMYSIQGRTHWTKQWRTVAHNVTAKIINKQNSRREYQLESVLSPWSVYSFRLKAFNELGYGEYSAPSPQVNTKTDIPFIAPQDVGGGGGKTGDLTITWKRLEREDQNAPNVRYRVFWRRVGLDPERQFKKHDIPATNTRNFVVVLVDPVKYFYTEYEVKVQAFNREGAGPISEPVVIYSAEDMPQAQPTEVAAYAHNATAINVTWVPIEPTRDNIRGELIGYRIKYWRKSDEETDNIIRLNLGAENSATIVGLIPNTFYWVRVMAYNGAGAGPESERFLERTWRFPPLTAPNAVEVSPVNPSTIRVTWRGITPSTSEEPLTGYKVKVWETDQDFTKANETFLPIGNELEVYISDLTPGKIYKLRVMGFSRGGEGKMSSPPWEFQMGDPEMLRGESQRVLGGGLSSLLTAVLPLVISALLQR